MNKLASLSVCSCYVCRGVTSHLNVRSAPCFGTTAQPTNLLLRIEML